MLDSNEISRQTMPAFHGGGTERVARWENSGNSVLTRFSVILNYFTPCFQL